MLRGLLLDSLTLFKNRYIGIAMVILPIYVPVELWGAVVSNFILSEESGIVLAFFTVGVVEILAYPVYTAGLIFYIASVVESEAIDTGTAWRLGIKYWVPVIVLGLFVGILVVFGLILLIVPGLFFAARFAFSPFLLLFKNRSPLEAMGESWHATKNFMWIILGGYLLISTVLYGPQLLLEWYLENKEIELVFLENAFNILHAYIDCIYPIFAFRVYHLAIQQA